MPGRSYKISNHVRVSAISMLLMVLLAAGCDMWAQESSTRHAGDDAQVKSKPAMRQRFGTIDWPDIPKLIAKLETEANPGCREAVVRELAEYKDDRVVNALLKALADDDEKVQVTAAETLARFRVEELIEPLCELVITAKSDTARRDFIEIFRYYPRGKPKFADAVNMLGRLEKTHPKFSERNDDLEEFLGHYAKKTELHLGLVPLSARDWQDWWSRAEPLFDDYIRFLPESKVQAIWGDDPSVISFCASLNKMAYEPGEPIQIDLAMSNNSDRPLRTIFPRLPAKGEPHMAWGLKLERIDPEKKTIVETQPSSFYIGSYAGPPHFGTLPANRTFDMSNHDKHYDGENTEYSRPTVCLQEWVKGIRLKETILPIAAGTYALTITFDTSEYAGVRPQGVEVIHRWVTPTVWFTVR